MSTILCVLSENVVQYQAPCVHRNSQQKHYQHGFSHVLIILRISEQGDDNRLGDTH